MIDVILSPDLQLEEKCQDAKSKRLQAANHFRVGQTVRAGKEGMPGRLECMSTEGFASIRWSDGSLLTGVECDNLYHVAGNPSTHNLPPNQMRIISDEEMRQFVLLLREAGYKSDPTVWNISISYVEYACGENFCVMYSEEKMIYDLHPNEKPEEIGHPLS